MSAFLQLILTLAIILAAAKIAGYISTRFGQPSVFGELLIGVILGPSVIDIIHLGIITDTHLGEIVNELGEIGVLLLMFLAGMELHIKDLAKNTKVSAISGILGVIVPVIMGFYAGIFFNLDFNASVFLGLTLAATSVSISAQTLIELGFLRTKVGLGLLGAAVFDDILVIFLLSFFSALVSGGTGVGDLVTILLRMFLFFIVAFIPGIWLLPKFTRMIGNLSISQGLVSFGLVVIMLYGFEAELIGGMAAITGTFIAGLLLGRTAEKNTIASGIQTIAYGFIVPIFFVSIGLKINIREFNMDGFWLLIVILVISIVSKILGSGLGAKIGGFSWLESYQLGTGMVSRGEVGLIVVNIGASLGLLNNIELTAIVITILISTLVTPILLKNAFLSPPSFLIPKSEPETPQEVN